MLILKLSCVSKYFGNRCVFKDISNVIHSGQCLVISGPNGSGKSTLTRIIAGILRPSNGEVSLSIDGCVIDEDRRRDVIGLVAPDIVLYDELTAFENLRFFARMRGVRLGEDELAHLTARVGLSDRGNDLLGSFSSGMKQRLKYSFALLHKPALLLLDEPMVNLDQSGCEVVEHIIEEQKREGIVVLATNNRKECEYGEKVIELGN